MDVWKYKIISRVEQDISLVRLYSWGILVNTRNKFHISAHQCIILYLNLWQKAGVTYEKYDTVSVTRFPGCGTYCMDSPMLLQKNGTLCRLLLETLVPIVLLLLFYYNCFSFQ